MFVSKEHLRINLGVDADIAAFFVNRQVPVNNLYWRNRLLYISRGTGYLFIPLIFDLKFKCGLAKETILDEAYVGLMEKILHYAARHEFEHLALHQSVESCKELLSGKVKNEVLYNDLIAYYADETLKPYKYLGTSSKPLNRGDTFLFLLCYLNLTQQLTEKIIAGWYALVPSFLLMDDIMDLSEDIRKNEENSILDFGEGSVGVERAIQYLRNNFARLKILNLQLGEYFGHSLEKKLQTPYLQTILNHEKI